MIVFKLGFVVGLLLASPVLIYQAWAFLSPALYDRERKVIFPALVVGLGLFLVGASLGYIFVVPQALRVFFSFQAESLQPMITYDAWFGFVLQIVLALGLSFELPLVIIILAALGVVTPAGLHRFRRYAVVLSFVAGAVLSPGADVFSMLMMTFPLLLLYEIGVAGAVLIARRRLRHERAAGAAAAAVRAAMGGLATPANAQVPTPGRAAGQDTTRAPPGRTPGQALDSAQADRLGLPTAPKHSFAPEDSAYRSLLDRPGYTVTKYRSDSAAILAEQKQLMLMGEAMTEREGATMEADEITYDQPDCMLEATGDPHFFRRGPGAGGRAAGVQHLPRPRRGARCADQLRAGQHHLVPARRRGQGLAQQPDLRRPRRHHQLRPAGAALSLQRARDQVGVEHGAGGAPGGAVHPGRPGPLAAVHLPGPPPRPAFGPADPAVRLLGHHPPVLQLLPPDLERGVLLGDERLHGPHRPDQLVLGAVRGARVPDRLPLAQPVPERHVRDQQAVGVGGGSSFQPRWNHARSST